MATLALSLAGQVVGGLVGGPFGATIGRALGALAGSVVDNAIFGEKREAATSDIRLQGSSEGGAVPRLYGWSRVSGNIIWARELEILGGDNAGAKGLMQTEEEEVIGASFAVAFCEGEVHRLGRIWADGQLLDTEGLTLRFYRGTDSQLPDGLIEATQGTAPAYRGICYLVVEQLPLNRFGNRIPHLSVELCRVVGDLEPQIQAVTVIPGATEFGYDPKPLVRVMGRGQAEAENSHAYPSVSDWTLSIDELTALCPKLEHVALVVAWFGDDLRCGHCGIGPRVEAADRQVRGAEWRVAGLGRSEVPVVSSHAGGPAYGGTPSDASVRAAIADLQARGLKVTLYPLVMMDVPAGNGLPDPYGGAEQGAFPWRGRITCHPAPGQPGSPDQTAGAAAQIASFVAGYRTMVLHYADMAAETGVDTLIIGSEMRGLTTVRGAGNSFPFVSALVDLAADVRAVVGAATTLTYAADWSEYSGYQPGGGEKFFHLDPLWASPDIDAVGIDNYMPLADWRDGHGHLDAQHSANGYDLDYLGGNIAGGEGFDWFYASDADRVAQVRTPISDGAHDEPWIWRYKDIRSWWSLPHHDRPGGVRQETPTTWVPGSKPIFFTELGCSAMDKGANQPNIFGDAKSAESGRPYFSNGLPDALIQRQALRAHQQWWRDPSHNPAGMLDMSRIYHWTWDARPYPQFPGLTDVCADGVNHRNGHWLTGRLGAMASDELAKAIAADHDLVLQATPAAPLVTGLVLNTATTARDALEPIMEATALRLRNRQDGLALDLPQRGEAIVVEQDSLAQDERPTLTRRRADPAEAPGRMALTYFDRERDYLTATVTAINLTDGQLAGEASSMTLDGSAARQVAERMLDSRSARHETLDFDLPPSLLALEPGDLVQVAGLAEGPFEIQDLRDGVLRRVKAQTLPGNTAVATAVDRPISGALSMAVRAEPVVVIAHLPPEAGTTGASRLAVGAFAQPWPGEVTLVDAVTGAVVERLGRRAAIGSLSGPLAAGPTAVWDRGSVLDIRLLTGHLASMDSGAVLAGANRIAVEHAAGWEIIGFATAELLAPGAYRLVGLLRGLDGSTVSAAAVGSNVRVLDGRVRQLPVAPAWLGETRRFRAYAGSRDVTGVGLEVGLETLPALPLSPVHLRAERQGSDIVLRWTRRSRSDGEGWGVLDSPLDVAPERYRVEIFDGTALVRQFEVSSAAATYLAADQVADFGSLPDNLEFTVAQLSAVLGAGPATRGEFHG